MRAWKRPFWLALAAAVVAAVAAGIWWSSAHQPPPQMVTLPSGEQYQFVGVTYGTNNVPPPLLAKVVHWLPRPLADRVRQHAGARISQVNEGEKFDGPHLFVWLKRVSTNGPGGATTIRPAFMPTAVLANEAGVQAGEQTFEYFQDNVTWAFVSFGVVPKRSKTLECRLYRGPYGQDSVTQFGKVVFANPVYGHFAKWEPEPVPAVKRSGDLEVRLDSVLSGNPQSGATVLRPNGSRAPAVTPADGGSRIVTRFDYSVRSARGTNERWVLQSAELGDATGNRLKGQASLSSLGEWNSRPETNADWRGGTDEINATLWPDEPAWRLKLGFKRSYGIDSNDVVTFRNVPIPGMGTTNTAAISNVVGGRLILLKDFERHADVASNMFGEFWQHELTGVTIEVPGKSADLALDVLGSTTDAGDAPQFRHREDANSFTLMFRSIPTNATKMDLTVVAQKVWSVEFLVKPPH